MNLPDLIFIHIEGTTKQLPAEMMKGKMPTTIDDKGHVIDNTVVRVLA